MAAIVHVFKQIFHLLQSLLSQNSLCRAGWPQTLRDLPATDSGVLELKVCDTILVNYDYNCV